MYTQILVILLCSWKLVTLFLKLEDQKLQTFAALKVYQVIIVLFA